MEVWILGWVAIQGVPSEYLPATVVCWASDQHMAAFLLRMHVLWQDLLTHVSLYWLQLWPCMML